MGRSKDIHRQSGLVWMKPEPLRPPLLSPDIQETLALCSAKITGLESLVVLSQNIISRTAELGSILRPW